MRTSRTPSATSDNNACEKSLAARVSAAESISAAVSIRRRCLFSLAGLLVAIAIVGIPTYGADPNPQGFIRTCGYNLLFPLINSFGCDGGGIPNMERNWVAPHDFATESAAIGELWDDIDYGRSAAATGHGAHDLSQLFFGSDAAAWYSLPSIDPDLADQLDTDGVDFASIIDFFADTFAGTETSPLSRVNVVGAAQTYVENEGNSSVCAWLNTTASGAIQVWVNEQIVLSHSDCGNDPDRVAIQLEPGINRITVLSWQGDGAWDFTVSLTDLDDDNLFLANFNTAETGIAFLGAEPTAPPVANLLRVARDIEGSDSCSSGTLTVSLKGNGLGGGTTTLAEVFDVSSDLNFSISNVSSGGQAQSFPVGGRVTWVISWGELDVADINSSGVSYQVSLQRGSIVEPLGFVNGCYPIVGLRRLSRVDVQTGPIGIFDTSHDIGSSSGLALGSGEFSSTLGNDGMPGTLDDVYTIDAAGSGIGATGDAFHFAYQRRSGEFSLRTRTTSLSFPPLGGSRARYGLMARRDCNPDAQFSMVHANLETLAGGFPGGDGVYWLFRHEDQIAASVDERQSVQFPKVGEQLENHPEWFRLDRRGNTFFGYASNDGLDWTLVGSNTWYGLEDSDEVLIGFALTRESSSAPGQVMFTEAALGAPLPAEIFDNEIGNPGFVVRSESFDSTPDGSLPAGMVRSCAPNDCEDTSQPPRVVDKRLLLISQDGFSTASSVFFSDPVPIRSGQLIIEYTLRLQHTGIVDGKVIGDPNPGHGMTMTVIAGTDPTRVGSAADGLGYAGIGAPSVAIEADAFRSKDDVNEGLGSPTDDGLWHLGINTGGNAHSITISSIALPDLFAAAGVRHRVILNSEGFVQVFVAPGANGAGGGVEEDFMLAAEGNTEPLATDAESLGVVGFTGSTAEDSSTTGEVDDVVITFVPCDDTPEIAAIEEISRDGNTFTLSAAASSAGQNDAAEPLSFAWDVSGTGTINGARNGETVQLVVGDGEVFLTLTVDDGRCTNPAEAVFGTATLLPGDVNQDSDLDISDPVSQLNFLFSSGELTDCFVVPNSVPPQLTSLGVTVLDFNGDGENDISDPVSSLNYLFAGQGFPPHALGADCVRILGSGGCANNCAP